MSRKKSNTNAAWHIDNVNVDIDYDKLALAIIKAQEQVKIEKEKKANEEKEKRLEEWHKTVNFKEYPEDEVWYKKVIHSIRNSFFGFFSLVTFKKKNVKNDIITYNLLRLVGSGIFNIIKILLYIVTAIIIFNSFFTIDNNVFSLHFQTHLLIYAVGSFLFARIFRIAAFEMENMKDKNYLIAILSATTCFFAMIFALIALFKG